MAFWSLPLTTVADCSGGDLGSGGVGEIGEEDLAPVGGARGGADILHVEDVVLEVFVEDARLDFVGSLRVEELGFEAEGCLGSFGREVESVGETDEPSGDGDDSQPPRQSSRRRCRRRAWR